MGLGTPRMSLLYTRAVDVGLGLLPKEWWQDRGVLECCLESSDFHLLHHLQAALRLPCCTRRQTNDGKCASIKRNMEDLERWLSSQDLELRSHDPT